MLSMSKSKNCFLVLSKTMIRNIRKVELLNKFLQLIKFKSEVEFYQL